MNFIVLKGNIGNDPVIRSFEWGKTASFSLATTESYKNKKGDRVTDTDWHNIVFRGPVCDTIEKHLHKGDQVLVTGKSKTRQYKDKNEKDHWTTEVIADSFEFCGSPKKEETKTSLDAARDTVDFKNNLPDTSNRELSDLPF